MRNRKVSGLYIGTTSVSSSSEEEMKLKLRIDIDGKHSTNVISGDLFSERAHYLSSFRFEEVKIKTSGERVEITGFDGQFDSDTNNFRNIKVSIPLTLGSLEAGAKWVNIAGSETECSCKYESPFFRRIEIEHDYEEGVRPLEPYNPADLPSPTKRSSPLSITDAYAEAGIEIVEKQKTKRIPHPTRTRLNGIAWTDNQLYAAMTENFTPVNDKNLWRIWLFSANEYVIGDFKGNMLYFNGQRVGCAVFQHATGWQTARERRMRLFIYVHELGHCFNLPHPWNWPLSNRPSEKTQSHKTLSWMNYPWTYRSPSGLFGDEAFWNAFNFQFSKQELIHLRHGFRNNVICSMNSTNSFSV